MVIYGITECPKGTSRSERLTQDLSEVVTVLSKVSSSIESQAIKDCYRLGKFNPQKHKPRPILVRLIRIADVNCILSNRRVLSSPIIIKPDMTPEERHRESVLLKERWNLIQAGIPKNVIKIQESRLYVKNRLHGQFKDSIFVPSSTSQTNGSSSSSAVQSVSHTCSPPTSDTTPSVSNPNSQLLSPPSIVSVTTPSTAHVPHSVSCNLSNTDIQTPSPTTFVPTVGNQATSTNVQDTNLNVQSTN